MKQTSGRETAEDGKTGNICRVSRIDQHKLLHAQSGKL